MAYIDEKFTVRVFQPSTASSRSAVSSSALSDLITAMGDNLTHFNMSSNKMAGLPFVFKALSVRISCWFSFNCSRLPNAFWASFFYLLHSTNFCFGFRQFSNKNCDCLYFLNIEFGFNPSFFQLLMKRKIWTYHK